MPIYYIPFDCETGGLDPDTTDLLTVYMAVMDENFKILEELDLKLKPDGGKLPICEASALDVNKINIKEHLENPSTITYSQAKQKLTEMLKKYLSKGRYSNLIPFGHNVRFDIDYLQKYIIPKKEWDNIFHYRIVDTMPVVGFLKDCKWLPKDLGNLSSIADYFGIPKRDAHNAKEDTLMTIDTYKSLISLMNSKKDNQTSNQDLISLLESE